MTTSPLHSPLSRGREGTGNTWDGAWLGGGAFNLITTGKASLGNTTTLQPSPKSHELCNSCFSLLYSINTTKLALVYLV